MAISITITDGTDTITIAASSGDAILVAYPPVTPEEEDDQVSESLDVQFYGGNTAIKAALAKLEKLRVKARARARGAVGVSPVYMKVTLDADVWRSEVYEVKLVETAEWIKGEYALGIKSGSLVISRAAWWDAETAVTALLTNGNGTGVSPINIYDNNDGSGSSPNKQNNWVSIPAAQISGDLPAPAFLKFQNLGAGFVDTLMVANNVFSDPANLVAWYEAETGSGDTSDTSASGDAYHAFGGSSNFDVLKTITTEAPRMMSGAYRVLARLHSGTPLTWKIKPKLKFGDQIVYGPTQTVTTLSNFYLFDLGIVLFPFARAYADGAALSYNSAQFGFNAQKSGGDTIDVDFLQLTPLDGWRNLKLAQVAVNYWIVLDELGEKVYQTDNSAAYVSPGNGSGAPLMLYPGRENRLHFLWAFSGGPSMDITYLASVAVMYRPRRRTL